MSDKGDKLSRKNMMLDDETIEAIDKYQKRHSLDNRSQAVRHIFKQDKKQYEDNQSTEERSS